MIENSLIALKDISFHWHDEEDIISQLSLQIERGEKVVLLGANGCGKSTLLKIINCLIEPQKGELYWQGELLNRQILKTKNKSLAFRRSCVLLFQHPEAMLFNPSIRDEISYGLRQLKCNDIEEKTLHWAQIMGFSQILDKPPFLLSGGQKQKLALAAILALDPELILLDEPSSSLDPKSLAWLIDTLIESDKTLIIATHNLTLATELGRRCLVFGEKGKILFDGETVEALENLELLEFAGLAHRHTNHNQVHVHNYD